MVAVVLERFFDFIVNRNKPLTSLNIINSGFPTKYLVGGIINLMVLKLDGNTIVHI